MDENIEKRNNCSACLMPFSVDPGNRESGQYCSYCFHDGRFCFDGTREEFQKMCKEKMIESGMSKMRAAFFTWMIRFAPHWKGK